MSNKKSKNDYTLKLVTTAVLAAIVIFLQLASSLFKFGAVNFSFVLVPIVLGGIFVGKVGASILGFIFGLITLLMGIFNMDPFTHILFENEPVITILICIVKATAAGFISALLYQLIKNKNKYLAVITASIAAPIVNTGLFILGSLLVQDTLRANFMEEGTTLLYFLFIGCAGINFLVELAINIVFAPSIYKISQAFKK